MNPLASPVDPRVARTRELVLAATAELLADEGPETVTHRRVAERAGVGRATVYRHWPRREDLLYDALASVDVAWITLGDGPLRRELVDALEAKGRDLDSPIAATVFATVMERAEWDDEALALRRRLAEQVAMTLRQGIAGAVRRGELRAGVDAGLVVTQIMGSLVYRRFLEGEPVDGPFVRRVVDAVLAPWVVGG
jgi:AcrR family transcriptional regulator